MKLILRINRLAAIGLLIVCVCGCSAPPTVIAPVAAPTTTPTLPPTATPSPTETPNRKATQDAAPTASILEAANVILSEAKEWPITFRENFDKPLAAIDAGWEVGKVNEDVFTADMQVIDGQYHLEITPLDAFSRVHWAEAAQEQLGTFYLAADAQKLDGVAPTAYGLAFRWKDNQNFYLFLLSSSHEFLTTELRDNRWLRSKWTPTDLIKKDQPNRLSVVAKDGVFFFYINDTYVYQMRDYQPESVGYPALAYQVERGGDHVILAFDNYEIREPEGAARGATSTPRPTDTLTVSKCKEENTFLLVINAANDGTLSLDGKSITVKAGRNEFWVKAGEGHTVATTAGSKFFVIAGPCQEQSVNLR